MILFIVGIVAAAALYDMSIQRTSSSETEMVSPNAPDCKSHEHQTSYKEDKHDVPKHQNLIDDEHKPSHFKDPHDDEHMSASRLEKDAYYPFSKDDPHFAQKLAHFYKLQQHHGKNRS